MPFENPFLSYIDRSYNQIKQAVLSRLAVIVPEVTDNSESNILVRLINVYAAIAEMLGYYLDNMARETFLSNARLYFTAVKIAKQYDYRIASSQAASVDLQFTFQQTGTGPFTGFTVPAGTEVQTAEGIQFFTVEDLVFPTSSLNTITGIVAATNTQAVTGVNLGTSDGNATQVFTVPTDVAGFTIVAIVGGLPYIGVETFAFSGPTDQHFVQSVDENKNVIITFGDGVNGLIPPLGDSIDINYNRCDGEDANVAANTVTNIISALPTPPTGYTIAVSNPSRAAGGTEVEDLASLKKHIPLQLRTNNRAVTEQDFVDIATLNPQVAQASVSYSCGKFVSVYIVPDGGGIASQALLDDVSDFFEPRRIITTSIDVLAAGEIRIQLSLTLRVAPNQLRAAVEADVRAALLDFFSVDNQTIGGTLRISDIYQTIENVTGVSSSTIEAIVPIPYGRPDAGNTTPILTWTPSLLDTSVGTFQYRIVFTSATSYQLYKEAAFISVYNVGDTVTTTEITFTISGSYALGDVFTFVTYPFSTTDLELMEQSIPAALSTDITINATGGI